MEEACISTLYCNAGYQTLAASSNSLIFMTQGQKFDMLAEYSGNVYHMLQQSSILYIYIYIYIYLMSYIMIQSLKVLNCYNLEIVQLQEVHIAIASMIIIRTYNISLSDIYIYIYIYIIYIYIL